MAAPYRMFLTASSSASTLLALSLIAGAQIAARDPDYTNAYPLTRHSTPVRME